MKLIRDLETISPKLQGGAVTIGNFDGVHLGHAALVQRLKDWAQRVDGPAIVFTFAPHPVCLLRPEAAPHPLTWIERKVALLTELGVDTVVAYPTDATLLKLTPEEFFGQIVQERLAAKALIEGPNFYFGHERAGDVGTLAHLCGQTGIALEIVEPTVFDGDFVSSSRLRKLIAAGDVDAAIAMMTHPYRVRGMVTHGARRGGSIGFPTANVEAVDTLVPGEGVYAARAITSDGVWPAAVNLGPNPTFGEDSLKFETHLIGFDGSLYGQPLEVDFLARLRDIRPFDCVDDLTQQLRLDVQKAASLASK